MSNPAARARRHQIRARSVVEGNRTLQLGEDAVEVAACDVGVARRPKNSARRSRAISRPRPITRIASRARDLRRLSLPGSTVARRRSPRGPRTAKRAEGARRTGAARRSLPAENDGRLARASGACAPACAGTRRRARQAHVKLGQTRERVGETPPSAASSAEKPRPVARQAAGRTTEPLVAIRRRIREATRALETCARLARRRSLRVLARARLVEAPRKRRAGPPARSGASRAQQASHAAHARAMSPSRADDLDEEGPRDDAVDLRGRAPFETRDLPPR